MTEELWFNSQQGPRDFPL